MFPAEEKGSIASTLPCLVRDELLTSCPIAVYRGFDPPAVCMPSKRKPRRKPEAGNRDPTCLAQGTIPTAHTTEAGVFLKRWPTRAAALFFPLRACARTFAGLRT